MQTTRQKIETLLESSKEDKDIETLKELLNSDAAEVGKLVNASDAGGNILLHSAAAAGNKEFAVHLLQLGSKVNHQNHIGQTPLHLAVTNNHVDMVEFLISMVTRLLHGSSNACRGAIQNYRMLLEAQCSIQQLHVEASSA